MQLETLRTLQAARAERRAVVLATRIADGAEACIFHNSSQGALASVPEVQAAARMAFSLGKGGTIDTPGGKVFINVFQPAQRLIVVGAVHIAQALAPMASLMDFAVTVIDPRRAFATDARFPGITVIQEWPDEALQQLAPDSGTAVVTLTHDPKLDDPALEVALKSDAYYVGALGSRRTHAKRKERLAELGIDDALFARIHGPVGLSIGARSPAEIAVSILAQIVETKAKLAQPADAKAAA